VLIYILARMRMSLHPEIFKTWDTTCQTFRPNEHTALVDTLSMITPSLYTIFWLNDTYMIKSSQISACYVLIFSIHKIHKYYFN
jgi:hypothetical protein